MIYYIKYTFFFNHQSNKAQSERLDLLTYLMFINLEQDSFQDEGGWRDHVEGLLCLSQPINEVLQRIMKICGHR